MSYCRWSTDDFQCDVYCYAHVDGTFTTHVAGWRKKPRKPFPPPVPWPPNGDEEWAAYWVRYKFVNRRLDRMKGRPIGLPHDGQTIKDESEAAMADTLEMLANEGYNVPAGLVDELRLMTAAVGERA